MDEGMKAEGDSDVENGQEDEAAVRHPGFLSSAWSFSNTFSTSLLPAFRPHPATLTPA